MTAPSGGWRREKHVLLLIRFHRFFGSSEISGTILYREAGPA
jgi:hypothetical protein